MRPVRSSFNGRRVSNLFENESLRAVRNRNALYIHCPSSKIESSMLELKPFKEKPLKIILMNNEQELDWTFEPIAYKMDLEEKYLRIRNIPTENIKGPYVIKIEF